MATGELERPRIVMPDATAVARELSVQSPIDAAFAALASLRLTVTLFALAIVLIFLGTLAQKDQDVWRVVYDTYFHTWFARVDLVVFERLVQIFFKHIEWNLANAYYFYIPGGKLVGLALLANLTAAHAIRFRIAATGRRLTIGLGVIAAGLAITYLAIQSGMNSAVESELSPAFCDFLRQIFRGTLALLTLAGVYVVFFWAIKTKLNRVQWRLLFRIEIALAALTIWLLITPEMGLDNSGIRILWQLIKGMAAGVVLLVGCIMVFRKRAGIVLLHGGVALMMLSELMTGIGREESRMSIAEGQTVNYSDDIRTTELAVIDHSPAEEDRVTVVPGRLLVANMSDAGPIEHPDLPFRVRVHEWLPNAAMREVAAGEANPATAGFGERKIAEAAPTATGVGEGSERVDIPAAYVELLSKTDNKSLGTYLLYADWRDQPVEVDGHAYDLALRFKRIYHPFSLTLKEFHFGRYVGTNTPKDYSSLVEFKDPRYNIDREVKIWMNNPLRYAGTTLYQADFDHKTERDTVLEVVTNPSWMTPYVACMLVATGMLSHFGTMLVRFLRRRTEEAQQRESASVLQHTGNGKATKTRRRVTGEAISPWTTFAKWFPALIVLIFAGYVVSQARMPEVAPSEMKIYDFGKLPLAYQGRIKPYDTLARNSLQTLSGHQELCVFDEKKGKIVRREPAIRWLLDAISGANGAADHRIFYVSNLELLGALDLPHRPQFWRYSLNEIMHKTASVPDDPEITTELGRQIKLAEKETDKDLPFEQKLVRDKVLQLRDKQNFYMALVLSFRSPPLSMDHEQIAASWRQSQNLIDQLRRAGVPYSVPPADVDAQWTPLMEAELELLRNSVMKQPTNPATMAISSMLSAYGQGDVATFNKKIDEYRSLLTKYEHSLAQNPQQVKEGHLAKAEVLSQPKVKFEVFFNQFSPFYYATVLYVFAFVLGVLSWVGWTEPLRRASIWLLWFTFALHTFALVARIYISGRPPITNLYSTAIFIGWGAVLMGLVFESVYRLGLGNIAASVIGFLTLLVAYNLSLDGDTFIVLQAVLDTQFWLATHVVCINLGYVATYLTGMWGVLYILLAHVFPVLDADARHKLTRTLYGTLCFAIFFSFIGTVLGGLWADDSWGRFWGWDPKENGALMIVLWNALVLHARWGGLVKGRGLATLAVAGNIVTTWSYFGVNELGVGLHSYGASDRSTGMWLLAFGATQLALIGLGLMPQRWFETLRLRDESFSTS